MNRENAIKRASSAQKAEDMVNRAMNSLRFWSDGEKHQMLALASTMLAEIRFFAVWIADVPQERHLAVERLISFLTDNEIPEANAGPSDEDLVDPDRLHALACDLWKNFCGVVGIEPQSADELEYSERVAAYPQRRLSKAQYEFVKNYCGLWDAMVVMAEERKGG